MASEDDSEKSDNIIYLNEGVAMDLKELVKKEKDDLTADEIKFMEENIAKMSDTYEDNFQLLFVQETSVIYL